MHAITGGMTNQIQNLSELLYLKFEMNKRLEIILIENAN